MKVRRSGFDFEITEEDLFEIRKAMNKWKNRVVDFDGATLYHLCIEWKNFIDTEWNTWDISEYNHDIDCRLWIQVAIEYSTPKTKEKLINFISEFDDEFLKIMKPKNITNVDRIEGLFKSQAYFWELNTIYLD